MQMWMQQGRDVMGGHTGRGFVVMAVGGRSRSEGRMEAQQQQGKRSVRKERQGAGAGLASSAAR